jgi:putative flippase GtrA
MAISLKKIQNPLIAQFIRFCIVGFFGVLLNYSIFLILFKFFNVYYIISSATGFILSVGLAFLLNNKYTFKTNSNPKKTAIKYFLVNLISITIGQLLLFYLVHNLGINIYLANFFTLGFTTFSNFAGSKFFAFN